ncbi:hypothetical protein [Burkholderia sp. Cy-637]|uniref:hypothetical protein n=1 Tax=Burkholderia sp. Cy-637 TaxID=2608327 RepID=UPI0014218AE0|nr:hypothetical protein [Burkholderia sp. Cy-637]NIF88871.1 hypothetical protein [Burkholderia sp. Cy-637]
MADTKRLSLDIDAAELGDLETICKASRMTISEFVRRSVRLAVDTGELPGKKYDTGIRSGRRVGFKVNRADQPTCRDAQAV